MIRRSSDNVNTVIEWWRDMQPRPYGAGRGDRAALARLRHAGGILEASMQPACVELCRALGARYQDMNDIALIAAVLADLRKDDRAQTIARALGGPENDSRLCKTLRFQRILEAKGPDAQLMAFRRALAMLKHTAHLADLTESLLEWNDPFRRDSRRQRWLYDYFHTMSPDQSKRQEAMP